MAHALNRTEDELDAILLQGSGSLVETPYPILLLALAFREKSAILTLQRNPLQKEIVFANGAPVDCESNIATETFGRFLAGSGKLSATDCHTALSLSASRGVPFEQVLAEQKLLAPAEIDRMLQQSLGRKLLEPFSWKSGTFDIAFEEPAAAPALRVKVPQLILTGILKVETQESVDEALAGTRDQFLALAPNPLFDLDEIRLSSEQQKIIDAARDGARIADVANATGIDPDDAHRILYALILLGALEVRPTPQRAAPMFELENPFRKPTMDVPLPPPSREPAVPQLAPAATREELLAAAQSYRDKDAFALLDVGSNDGPVQFTRAFLRMAERFLPSRYPEAVREKAQEVFLAAARAYAELADPVRRAALLASRATLVVPAPAPVPVAPVAPEKPERKPRTVKAAIIDPELLCKNGRELAEAGKLRDALSSFEMAAACDAQNGTYAAEVAWCRFRLNVSNATTTFKMLKNAIRIDPRSGLANLYAGKVATVLGNHAEASQFLDRAAMLMPKDLRVVEALKALR